MSKSSSVARTPAVSDDSDPMQVNSNEISNVLAQFSATALAETQHVRLTSTPGDDLVEEDFADRVRSLLRPMTALVSLTICIPSMARLHPSNSLPKVLDILSDASLIQPQCRLGLVVHEAEQAWSALPILNRIEELGLKLSTIDFSRAYLPVEALISAAQACGLASLTLDATQISSSLAPSDAVRTTANDPREDTSLIPTLTSLTVHAHPEASPGLDLLLHAAASTLTHLDLSTDSSESGMTFHSLEFPRLTRLKLSEDLLPETTKTPMPALQNLVVPALTRSESCDAIHERLLSSSSLWPSIREVRVSRVVAGDASEALAQLAEMHAAAVQVTIEELAVREPAGVTPAALAISERLVNAGPPIAGAWPLGFGERRYTRLKSIVLKVHDGSNCDEFVASLDAPNLEGSPSISLIGKKKGKAGKR